MHQQNLQLYQSKDGFRTVFKTKHGRLIYLQLHIIDQTVTVEKCLYLDRFRKGSYYAVPQKLTTMQCRENELLSVVATQLDRIYFGIEIIDLLSELSMDDFIQYKLHEMRCGYKFLLFVGSGEAVNGLPVKLQTRLANRLHRRIYLEINYHHDAVGVVSDCHYYDRTYRQRTRVIPQMLTTVFVPFERNSILQMVNRELDCDFTDLVVIDNTIDFEGNSYALCGNI